MSDQPSQLHTPAEPAAPAHEQPADEESSESAATPEELVAEAVPDDPDVGSDGTGVGELP
jgi:hypothetical protein